MRAGSTDRAVRSGGSGPLSVSRAYRPALEQPPRSGSEPTLKLAMTPDATVAPVPAPEDRRQKRAAWLRRLRPHLPSDWFGSEQRMGLEGLLSCTEHHAFNAAIAKRQSDVSWLTTVGDQLANIALEAQAHGRRGDTRRVIWGVTSKTTASLTAIVSAAVGGTVLAVNQLPPWGRYALAAVAFLAAALLALQPGDEFAADVRRHVQWTSLHHQIVAYIMVSLPTEAPQQAAGELDSFSADFDLIRGLQPTAGAIERAHRLGNQSLEERPPA
jgi:hypothetical protein